MALITTNRLFVDVEQNRAYSQFGSFNVAPQPFFIQGDQCPVELSLVRQTGVQGNPFEQVPFDGSSTFALKIGTTTLVATSTTTATTPSAPAITYSPIVAYNPNSWQVVRIQISPNPFGGFFSLNISPSTSVPISVNATALDVQTAIIAFGSPFTQTSVKVSKVGQYTWDVSFDCNAIGYSVPLTANNNTTGYDSRVMQLDMTAAGVATLLAGAASVEATLEFSIDVSGEVQTFLLTPCTVINDL